jgi:cell pole-organizing protein PopZ
MNPPIPPTPSSPATPAAAGGGAADPSMEDILASIRRILSEDETEPAAPARPDEPEAQDAAGSGVLTLDPSMLVEEPPPAPHPPPQTVLPAPVAPPAAAAEPHAEPESLLAPETAAAAASSMGSLLRTLASERHSVAVYRGGPTIEDLVREEIRPLLKQWLDQNLPPLVERLVRTEIERVVGRALS